MKSSLVREGGEVRRLFLLGRYLYQGFLLRKWHQNKPQPSVPFPISFPKTIAFISSGAKTQKKKQYHIPDATTEQMGYGIVSFSSIALE